MAEILCPLCQESLTPEHQHHLQGTSSPPVRHYPGCWHSHLGCAIDALHSVTEGAEVLMLDAFDRDPEDPNALEMRHRLPLLLIDGSIGDG